MNILTRRIREKNFMSNTMKENKMGTMPVNKLLINMALPMMISMLVQALYNIVDSIFVARISEEALILATNILSTVYSYQDFPKTH